MPTKSKTSPAPAGKPAKARPAATKTGVVTSDSRDKSRTVVLEFLTQHPKYGKFLKNRTVLQVHDPANESRKGDLVEVRPCRPVSRSKSWALVRIVEQRSRTRVEALQTAVENV
ncbi:MAG: 30S ribosomal protein S17 [Phycisphaerae bacterium]|nr:30S ribosomal protein S17 [Phycisphaerae bacterium]